MLDPAEWPQADADEPEAEEEHRCEHRGGDRQLDDQQPVERVVGVLQRRGDDEELVRVPDRLELHAEPRIAFDGVHREGSRPRPLPPLRDPPADRAATAASRRVAS